MVGQDTHHHHHPQNNNSNRHHQCQPVSSSTIIAMSTTAAAAANNKSNSNSSSSTTSPTTAVSSQRACVWCRENKRQLNYVLPTQHGKKECCSEICLLEFRRAYNKGTCTPCANCECVIRQQPAPHLTHNQKECHFCSDACMEEYKGKHSINQQQQKTGLTPAAKKKQYDPNKDFKWDDYMTLTNSRRAPHSCFKQHLTPPTNEFATEMKLEAIDPRNTTSTCIATVIGSVGPRIRLRLDGSDNANDFWRMIDSNEIQPIGTCEKNGGLLQPPLGFRMNASFWPMFLCKTLNGAQMAPQECFHPEPPTPRFNLFRVGEKLEAVDRKNPHLICVATVGAVDRDNIHITFDGWSGTFDYWTKYDSRDIFPVGWCELANHPLQPPGNKAPLIQTPISTPSSLSHHHHHQQISTHHHDSATPSQPNSPQSAQQQQLPPYTVTLHVHPTCNCGPYLDQSKLKSSPTIIGPSNIQEVYNQFIQILRQCSLKQAPLEKLVLVQGTEILEQGDFWTEILGLTERFRFCENFVNDKPFDEEEDGGPRGTAHGRARLRECHKCGGPAAASVRAEDKKPTKRKSSLNKETNGSSSSSSTIPLNNNSSNRKVPKVESQVPVQQQVHRPVVDPSDWTVEDVIRAIVNVDETMELHADLFRKHEIDGKAMLLLNSDMMMRYMGLKLGPALKICNIISKFKSKSLKNGSNGV